MPSPAEMVAELYDRAMIRDCLYRYCRGIDRADEHALRSAYWPDGTDRHGPYRGSAAGFIDWALRTLPSIERSVHQLHNILIDLRGAEAYVESGFTALHRQPGTNGAPAHVHMAGRYLDRFEKRGDAWRVADRTVVFDWVEERPADAGHMTFGRRLPHGTGGPDDPVYAFLAPRDAADAR